MCSSVSATERETCLTNSKPLTSLLCSELQHFMTFTQLQWIWPYRVKMDTWTFSSASFWASHWSPIRISYVTYCHRQETNHRAQSKQPSVSNRRSEIRINQTERSTCSTV